MLYYDRMDIAEGIDVQKKSRSKNYICHFWCF